MAPVDTFNAELAGDESVLKKDVKSMYKLGRKLGKGAYAVVHRGTLLSDKSITRAVKIIDERALGHEDIEALHVELQTMRKVQHPNIVDLYECFLHAGQICHGPGAVQGWGTLRYGGEGALSEREASSASRSASKRSATATSTAWSIGT